MNDVWTNLALAARYQRRAVRALVPEPVGRHGAAIARELRELALELLDADRAAPQPPDSPASSASTKIKVN